MTIRPWLRAALVAAAVAFTGAPPRAHAEGRKVLFVTSSLSPFTARMRAEIEVMGFEIEPAAVVDPDSTATTIAAVRIVEGPARRVELWITDPTTGHLTLRTLVTPSPGDDDASQTVRASEQLRAFFQPLREARPPSPPPPPPPEAQPPADAPAPEAQPPVNALGPGEPRERVAPPAGRLPAATSPTPGPRFVVGADLAIPFQPGGPGLDLGLHGRWMATGVLGVGMFVDVPLAGTTVKAAEGSASLSAPLFGADLSVVTDVFPPVRLSASAGLALAWVRTSGFAVAPYQGQPSDVAAALALFGGEIAPRLTDRTHLCLGARIGFSLPRVDVAFAGRPVAIWARPLGLLSAGVSVDL